MSFYTDEDLHLFSFKSPTSWAEMNETSAADCAFTSYAMRNGVKCDRHRRCLPFSKGTAFRNSFIGNVAIEVLDGTPKGVPFTPFLIQIAHFVGRNEWDKCRWLRIFDAKWCKIFNGVYDLRFYSRTYLPSYTFQVLQRRRRRRIIMHLHMHRLLPLFLLLQFRHHWFIRQTNRPIFHDQSLLDKLKHMKQNCLRTVSNN